MLEDRKNILQYAVEALASRPLFAESLEAGDIDFVSGKVMEKKAIVGMDTIFLTDAHGKVVAGSVTKNTDMSSLECVRDALSGTTSHDFESNNSVPYSMLVGTPVKNGERTV